MQQKEIVVVGGGPAGLSAAIEAAKLGAQVTVLDENSKPGGQLFKQIHKFFGSHAHNAGIRGYDIGLRLLSQTQELGVEVRLNAEVVGLFSPMQVAVQYDGAVQSVLEAKRILIAGGASENAVNFPGWTLPGVMGAGAAQTMVNVNRVQPGKRMVMLGSGNVGLIVSYQLMQAGVQVMALVEGVNRIGGYGVHAAKVRRAGVPFYLKHTIVRAEEKDGQVGRVVIAQVDDQFQPISGTEKVLEADGICIAVGLRPLTELTLLAGVRHGFVPQLGGHIPLHDENMQTSVPGIYVAGDSSGVEEANTAMDEGRLAGVAMAQSLGYVSDAEAEARKEEIRAGLYALRQGPFGMKRLEAKQMVLAIYQEEIRI